MFKSFMNESEDNSISIFSHSPIYIEREYNKYENNLLCWHNLGEGNIFDYEDLKSHINYPENQIEDICEPNKIKADSNRAEVIYDIQKKSHSIGDFNSISKSINRSSIADNIYIEIKNEEKSFSVNQNNEKSDIINNRKKNENKKDVFKIVRPNCDSLKSNINYPVYQMEDFFNSNKITADSIGSEDISEISHHDLSIFDFINIPILINPCSIAENADIEYKDDEKRIPVNQKNDKSSIISKKENNLNTGGFFRVVSANCFNIFHPGSDEKYPRDLINLIAENKTNSSLSKRNKIKKQRKFYSDNIRRRIKCGFHDSLKNTLNERLKYSGSNFFFDYLPQKFISDVTKDRNKQILDMTIKQLFSKNFSEIDAKYSEKCHINILAIEHIEKNKKVREKSNYNYYEKMKYYEIYEEYLRSKEFEENIIKLVEKKESEEYIKKYINLALHLIDYFCSN